MLGHLVEGQAVVGLSSTFDRPSRRKLFYHSISLYKWKFIAIFRTPPFKRDIFAHIKPFQESLWLAVGIWLAAIAIIVALLNGIYEDLQRSTLILNSSRHVDLLLSSCLYTSSFMNHRVEWCDWLLWPVSILSQRTMRPMPAEFSLKIILTTSTIVGAVLYIAFSGTLISFLTVFLDPISTLEQLLQSSFEFHAADFLIAVEGFRVRHIIHQRLENLLCILIDWDLLTQEATSPKLLSLMSRLPKRTKNWDTITAKASLMSGSTVFLSHNLEVYEDLNNAFQSMESCVLSEIVVNTEETRLGPVVLKHSPYKRTLDYQ